MRFNLFRRTGIMTLCLSLLMISACSPSPDGEESDADSSQTNAATESDTSASDGTLAISYKTDEDLNPFSASSSANQAVTGLIYDCLFEVDEDFTATAKLCESYYANEDGTEYTFTIRGGVKFSTGADLTVSDVIYSLSLARNSTLYKGRLSIVTGVSAATDEDGNDLSNSFTVKISKPHSNLPLLMNLPIIEYNTGNQSCPPGTGPYQFSENGDSGTLTANENYWAGTPPVDTIRLISSDSATDAFSEGELDIINVDRSTSTLALNDSYDVRNYSTSIMEYIGFNVTNVPNAQVRRAISRAIDRETIVTSCLNNSGIPSALPIHPSLSYYSQELNKQYSFDIDAAADILEQTEGVPFDRDAYDEGTQGTWLTLRLLVCTDSASRYECANRIAKQLSPLGIEVTVVGQEYNEYIASVNSGSFDMYYGQVKLQSDFDLSDMLSASGSINYGNVRDASYSELINQFIASQPSEITQSAENMCFYIMENAPISVVGFKQLSIVTVKGTITGTRPIQDNIFSNITNWVITA